MIDAFSQCDPAGVQCKMRSKRHFVTVADAGKLLDLAPACLAVKTFRVTLFADDERGCYMNFEKPSGANQVTSKFAVGPKRRNQGGDGNLPTIVDRAAEFGRPQYVGATMIARIAKTGTLLLPQRIAIDELGRKRHKCQRLGQRSGKRSLAGT